MIQYLHQCIFSPTIDTLCKAINNNHTLSFPGLTTGDIKKSLPPSTATTKGHMHAIKWGVWLNKKTENPGQRWNCGSSSSIFRWQLSRRRHTSSIWDVYCRSSIMRWQQGHNLHWLTWLCSHPIILILGRPMHYGHISLWCQCCTVVTNQSIWWCIIYKCLQKHIWGCDSKRFLTQITCAWQSDKQGSKKDIWEKKLTSKWLMEMTTESSSRKNHWCHKRPHHSPSLHGGIKFSYASVEWIDWIGRNQSTFDEKSKVQWQTLSI